MQDFKRKLVEWWTTRKRMLFLVTGLYLASFLIFTALAQLPGIALGRKGIFKVLKKQEPNTIQLVTVGDSLSYTTFSPLQAWHDYGITSLNSGQSAQEAGETLRVIERVFETQTPKVVLYEAHNLFYTKDAETIRSNQLTQLLETVFPAMTFHGMWNRDYRETHRSAAMRGFDIRDSVDSYQQADYMARKMKRETVPDYNIEYLQQMASICASYDAKLVLYSAPSPRNYNRARTEVLKGLAEENDLPYIDMNAEVETIELNWTTDMLDGKDHVNISGAQKTTDFLASYLKAHVELVDHRDDEAYASWNQEADRYTKTADHAIAQIRT